MSSNFSIDENDKSQFLNIKVSKILPKISSTPVTQGTITKIIGEGENAKNSLIWTTITSSFCLGGFTSLAVYFQVTFFQPILAQNLIEDIKSIWAIFIPVITLALGYSFGKGQK